MRGYFMPSGGDVANELWMSPRNVAEDEERSLRPSFGKYLQHFVRGFFDARR